MPTLAKRKTEASHNEGPTERHKRPTGGRFKGAEKAARTFGRSNPDHSMLSPGTKKSGDKMKSMSMKSKTKHVSSGHGHKSHLGDHLVKTHHSKKK